MPKKKPRKPVNRNEWEAYSKELRAIIENRKRGILLDPRDDFGVKGGAFELSSGHLQKKFLTLWQLFGNTQIFGRCMKMFAKKAQNIYATIQSDPTGRMTK